MTAFIKSDMRQTVDYGASFNQYLFDLLSKLVDKSHEQVVVVLLGNHKHDSIIPGGGGWETTYNDARTGQRDRPVKTGKPWQEIHYKMPLIKL